MRKPGIKGSQELFMKEIDNGKLNTINYQFIAYTFFIRKTYMKKFTANSQSQIVLLGVYSGAG